MKKTKKIKPAYGTRSQGLYSHWSIIQPIKDTQF